MSPALTRPLVALTFLATVIGVCWLIVYETGEASREPVTFQGDLVTSEGSAPSVSPVEDAAQPIPDIHVRATLLPQQGEPSALFETDHQRANWYRRSDALQPGFILTAIDKEQVTIRDDLHNAYYEFPLRSGEEDGALAQNYTIGEQQPLLQESNRMDFGDGQSISFGPEPAAANEEPAFAALSQPEVYDPGQSLTFGPVPADDLLIPELHPPGQGELEPGQSRSFGPVPTDNE